MSRFVRSSKYRHTFASSAKKDQCYENVKLSGSAWDTDLIKSNGKYLTINWQVAGGGAFLIAPTLSASHPPTTSTGTPFPQKLPDVLPLARGHSGPVLDTAFSPFNLQTVVSASEDGKILIWNVDDEAFEGWGEEGWGVEKSVRGGKGAVKDWESVGKLVGGGGRKVGQVLFNTSAENVLASASGDHIVRIWDITSESAPKLELKGHTDSIQCMAWNSLGNLLVTTSRDRKLRLFDPRTGAEAVKTTDGHSGIKGSRVVWLGDHDRIATTGFSRTSDRQMGLWDTSDLKNIKMETIDSSSGVIMPFFAEGNDILFLAGKGDGNIRYYEYADDDLVYLSEYKSSDPQRGMTFMPRRNLDVAQNEIARGFKVYGNTVEPLSFVVPRKSDSFQSDLFPPATSSTAPCTSSEWFSGKTVRPSLIDLESGSLSSNSAPIAAAPKAEATREEPKKSQTAPASYSSPVEKKEVEVKEKKEEVVEMKEEAKDLEIEQPDEEDDEDEVVVEKEVEKAAPVVAAAAPASSGADAKELASLQAEKEALKSQVAKLEKEKDALAGQVETMTGQLEKARKLAKELAAL